MLWYFNGLGALGNFVAELLIPAQRFRNSVLKVNGQTANRRFRGMGHIRRPPKWIKLAEEGRILRKRVKRFRAVKYDLTGRE